MYPFNYTLFRLTGKILFLANPSVCLSVCCNDITSHTTRYARWLVWRLDSVAQSEQNHILFVHCVKTVWTVGTLNLIYKKSDSNWIHLQSESEWYFNIRPQLVPFQIVLLQYKCKFIYRQKTDAFDINALKSYTYFTFKYSISSPCISTYYWTCTRKTCCQTKIAKLWLFSCAVPHPTGANHCRQSV